MGQTKLKESQVAAALNNQTGTDYTLGLVDSNRTVRMTNAAPNTVTVPANASVAIRIGSIITMLQWGAGQTTLVEDDGVTINTPNGLVLAGQGAAVDLIKVGVDEWDLVLFAESEPPLPPNPLLFYALDNTAASAAIVGWRTVDYAVQAAAWDVAASWTEITYV
jgi:hypothetical protein